ncbi:hypothetical protein A9Q91_00480 [Candidatus Gracilibacteria bacterium 28_42_T64]|nr:hypothetical protein A9Q91_00480 [Candidatus Gracilibacteria bacterium 28_42_T64]
MSEYFDVQSQLESSETQEDIKQDLAEDLQAAESILRYFKNEYGQDSERYQKVLKEYTELQKATIIAVDSQNKVIESELINLKQEFEDIKELETYGEFLDRVTSKDFIYSNVSEAIHSFNDSFSKEEIIELLENIKKYVSDEVSEDLSKIVDSLKKAKGKSPVIMLKITNIIGKISGGGAHNTAQEKYLRKIFGSEKGYNNDYITGYNNQVGNYVVKVEKFEKHINSNEIKDINSKALANYLMLAQENGLSNTDLLNKFGTKKFKELTTLWQYNKDTIAQIILKDSGNEKLVQNMITFSKEELKVAVMIFANSIDVNSKSIDFFKNHDEYIPLIKDKKIILELAKEIFLQGNQINNELKQDIEVLLSIDLDINDIHTINKNLFKNPKYLEKLIQSTGFTGELLLKARGVLSNEVLKVIINNNVKDSELQLLPRSIQKEVLGVNFKSIKKEDFLQAYEEFKKNPQGELWYTHLNIIKGYIEKNGVLSSKKEIKTLIQMGADIGDIHIDEQDIESALLLVENDPFYIYILPEEMRSHNDIIKAIIPQIDMDDETGLDLYNFFDAINIKDFNQLLFIFHEYKKIQGRTISKFLESPSTRIKILEFIKQTGNEDRDYSPEYENDFKEISKLLRDEVDNFHDLNKAKSNLIKQSEIKNNNEALKGDILQELTSNDFDLVHQKKLEEIISLIIENDQNGIIYHLLKDVFNNDEGKIKEFLTVVKEFELKESEKNLKDKEEQVEKQGIDIKVINSWQLSNKQKKEESNAEYNQRMLSALDIKKGTEEAQIIVELIEATKINSRLKVENNNIDIVIQRLKGKITIEDYDKLIEKQFQNDLAKQAGIEIRKEDNGDLTPTREVPVTNPSEFSLNTSGNKPTLVSNGETIEITSTEAKQIKNNPEALQNLVDFKKLTERLNLSFLWNFRSDIIGVMNNLKGTSGIDMSDNDLINKTEVTKLLNFVLEVIGEGSSEKSYDHAVEKMITINGAGILNNQTNTITGFGVVGQRFYELGYIGRNSFDTKHKSNLLGYNEVLNNKKTD